MMPFIDHLLNNIWQLQIIQHALSLHFNIPLRILDRNKILINPPIIESWQPPKLSDVKKFFNTAPKHFIKYFNNRNNSPWITLPSNSHPLVSHLRRINKWVAWEHFFYGNWLKENDYNNVIKHNYCNDSMITVGYKIDIIDHFDGYLIIGPLFVPPGNNSNQTFHENVAIKFSEHVRSAIDNEKSDKYVLSELALLSNTRGWINENHLLRKAKWVGRTFDLILKMNIETNENINLQRCTCNSIAQVGYLVSQIEQRGLIKKLKTYTNKSVGIELVQIKTNNPVYIEYNYNKLILKKGFSKQKIWVVNNNDSSLNNENEIGNILNEISDIRRELEVSYESLHHGFTNDSQTRFWTWLTKEFGIVSVRLDDSKEEKSGKSVYIKIAREIALLFNADMVTIYLYKSTDSKLEQKGTWFQTNKDAAFKEKWIKELKEIMVNASQNNGMRKKSITYRCVDDVKAHLCRAWFPDTNKSDPPTEHILNINKDFEPFRSAIAVPLLINHQLFGVLEIGGLNPYQLGAFPFRGKSNMTWRLNTYNRCIYI